MVANAKNCKILNGLFSQAYNLLTYQTEALPQPLSLSK